MDAIQEIKNYIESTGQSARQFCRGLGLSHSYLYSIKSGRLRPSYEVAEKIAREVIGSRKSQEAARQQVILSLLSLQVNANPESPKRQQAVDTSHAAAAVHTLGHTDTQSSPDGAGGSFSGSELTTSSSSPSSSESAEPADEPSFSGADRP